MRHARDARLFVGGPGAVPDHLDDDRRAVILDHDDLKPVIEVEGRNLARRGGACEGRGKREGAQKTQEHALLPTGWANW